jgi:hypothetical protein
MKPDVKEDWVEALRSDEYVQGQDWLDRNDRQCCLGVLADILDAPWSPKVPGSTIREYEGRAGTLGEKTLRRAGLTRSQQSDLAAMNDYGATFDEIADYIEAML